MRLLDTDHPFFRPLWIRVTTFGFTAGWTFFELWNGQILWACIVGALAVLSFYGFFIDFNPDRHKLTRTEDDPS